MSSLLDDDAMEVIEEEPVGFEIKYDGWLDEALG